MSGSTLSNRPRWVWEQSFLFLASAASAGANSYAFTTGGSQSLLGGTVTAIAHLLRPIDFDIYDMEQLYSFEARVGAGNVAPAVNLYWTLYPLAALTGTDAARTATVGAEVPNARTATVASPGANAFVDLTSPLFTLTSDGLYLFAMHIDATPAATSYMAGALRLGVIAR